MHVLTEHERERVRGSLHRQNVDAGAMICHRGDEARYWVGVLDGLVTGVRQLEPKID